MNLDTRQELDKRARKVIYYLAYAVVGHMESDFARSRDCLDKAVECAVFGETRQTTEYRQHIAKQEVEVSSDVKE